MRCRDGLGFWGLALAQIDGEDDEDGGRKEFALPVLEGFEPKLRIAEVGKKDRWRFAMVIDRIIQAAFRPRQSSGQLRATIPMASHLVHRLLPPGQVRALKLHPGGPRIPDQKSGLAVD